MRPRLTTRESPSITAGANWQETPGGSLGVVPGAAYAGPGPGHFATTDRATAAPSWTPDRAVG